MQDQQKPIKVLFETWKNLQHSYGIVSAFLLIHLHLNYGPNGKYGYLLDIYVQEAEYFRQEWKSKQKFVYTKAYNDILKNLKEYNGEKVDLIYRQTYPYNITVSNENISIPKCVFYTSEFAKITSDYFTFKKPDTLSSVNYNDYIKRFLGQFKNIYFTSPSEWSAKGMDMYLDDASNPSSSRSRNRIITHGVDTSIFKKHNSNDIRNETRAFYKVKENDILLINIGAMTQNKGIILVLKAMNVLVNKMKLKNYKLMLKGSGDLYQCQQFLEIYFAQFKQSGEMTQNEIDNLLTNHIIFTDKTLSFEKINDLFNSADLYISPYLCEGFGLVMLESLASGLQVLVPKTGSTKEYVSEIYLNGGSDYIHYVESNVSMDQNGMCQNNIKLQDIIDTILNIDFHVNKNENYTKYTQMIDYINKELSWDYASTLLFDYFKFILNA